MSQPTTDRNLLFGILALQMDFISRDALIQAMHAWVLEKSKALAQILLDQQALGGEEHQLLEALVHKHLQKHGNDPEKSLAAVSSVGSVTQELQQIADPDLQASLARVSQARPQEDDSWATVARSVGSPTSTGLRFRILRPHARGGLGRVSVAHDEELHREVALKEIQEQHADDPGSRSRFLVEAEITGGLEHPGIVPVYGLGTYQDGRPYYAMRFIRGDSLKEAIAAFHQAEGPRRDPGERSLQLRNLLGRFIDVCNAVAYAHSRGVLHRDLKPGNIMLGPYGETLVVDWGLAKPLGESEGTTPPEGRLAPPSLSGSAPTQLGTALGTPAFMSPEQAAGRLDQLGPATDVYSLGATLHCLLTGQPPFTRDPDGDILHQVQQGRFPPPRQVKKSVPPTLEAICLKAMALKPEERYESARALAEDVEHWLADEPVSAYREPARVRLGRWMRRNRTLVSSLAVLLLTAVAALTVGVVLLGVEQARTEKQRQLAVAERDRADANVTTASEQRDLALETLKDVIFDIHPGLQDRPGMQELRKKLLNKAQQGLEKVARSAETSSQIDRSMACIYFELGDIFLVLGDTRIAHRHYQDGYRIADALCKAAPSSAQTQRDLSVSYNKLGDVQLRLGDSKAALEAYHKSLEIRQALSKVDPSSAQAQRDLSISNSKFGDVQLRLGDSKAALEAYRKCLEIRQALSQADPSSAQAQRDLWISLNKLAWVLATCSEEALRNPAEAVTLAENAVKLALEDGNTHNTLGVACYRAGKWKDAVASLEKAIQLNKAGTSDDWFFLAMARYQLGNKEPARSHYEQAVQWMDKNKPNDPELRRFRAEAAALLGIKETAGPKETPK